MTWWRRLRARLTRGGGASSAAPRDRRRRPSEVRLDRLLRLPPQAIRREGAALDRATFDRVLAGAREFHEFA